MKVLVTGGAGYIGTELVYKLSETDEVKEVFVYDNFTRPNHNLFIGVNKLNAGKVKFVQGELLDSRKLRKLIKGIDVVYHLAARVSTPFADQSAHHFEQTNNWGTAELMYSIEDSNVQQLVYVSSLSVYGASSDEVDETCSLNPRTFYGISKMRGEEHVRRLSDKIKVHVFRCGNVYGYSKSMRFDSVINRFMFDANYNKRISINGDGNQRRSFIHVDKVTDVLMAAIKAGISPGTYNLVDRVLSINDIAEVLTEIYPEMEMLFVNQHLKLRELLAKPNEQVNVHLKDRKNTLKEELVKFKAAFTF